MPKRKSAPTVGRVGACALAALALLPALTHAQETEEQLLGMSLEQLAALTVKVATGTTTALQQAPSAVSVITAADLAAMGAQSLDEALQTVPGLQVSRSGLIMSPRYFIRGIASTNNPQTLVLVNGLPMTSLWQGDRNPAWQGVPVAAIERVEIIRGPGSAVYGADAFAGVINIITKGADDISGGSASLAHGSFDSTQASLTQAGRLGPVRAALLLNWRHTEGEHGTVASDAQSGIDSLGLGPPASLAPGPVNVGVRSLDSRLDLQWRHWRLRTAWQQDWDIGTGTGVADALDPNGRFGGRFGTADLLWDNPDFRPYWALSSRLSYDFKSFNPEANILFYPAGAFGGSFPQGVIDNPSLSEDDLRFEQTAVYSGFAGHRLRLGLGAYRGRLFDTDEQQNYSISSGQATPTPLPGGLTDVRGTALLFQPEGGRREVYGFVQDEWQLAPRWQLTTGLRADHYSDFGGTANPRIALVWDSTPSLTSKLLYGEAFRAPSLAELHVLSNPVNLGNPNLKPEKLKSSELAFSWRPDKVWALDVNFYLLRIRDFITYLPDSGGGTYTAQNVGRVLGRGMEGDWRWQTTASLLLRLNGSYQITRDASSGQPLGLATERKGTLEARWSWQPHWQLDAGVDAVGRRLRQEGDPREPLGGYASVNLALRRLQLPAGLALSLSVRNLFDVDIREPSAGPPPGQSSPLIPGDIPQAGRSVVLAGELNW